MERKGLDLEINLKKITPFKINHLPNKYYSNNWLKMHNKPMVRKSLRKTGVNMCVIGQTGTGCAYTDKMIALRGKEYLCFHP